MIPRQTENRAIRQKRTFFICKFRCDIDSLGFDIFNHFAPCVLRFLNADIRRIIFIALKVINMYRTRFGYERESVRDQLRRLQADGKQESKHRSHDRER